MAGATYTEDVADARLAGAVWVTFVRTPVAHARIVSVDASEALAAPGCVAVITAADLSGVPDQRPIMPGYPLEMAQPLLADTTVRYVGEAVAAVVTNDRYRGEDVTELVSVEYELLSAVVDPADAFSGPTLLFPELGTNVVVRSPDAEHSDDIFAGCEVVVTQTLRNQRVAPAPIEIRGAAAVWDRNGRLTVWLPNQGAQGELGAQGVLAGMLGLPTEHIHVITPAVGGAFGAKFAADPEHAVVCWVARQVDRPARWIETRSENLVAMTHGRAQRQTVTIGGDRDGRVRAYRLRVLQDSGAYPRLGAMLPTLTMQLAPAGYDIERVAASYVSVVTNTTPVGAYRGAGLPEAAFAIERAMDLFAAEIGMDPAEMRRRNLLAAFTEPVPSAVGTRYDSGDYPAALDAVLNAAAYAGLRREQARRRDRGDARQLGVGVSVYVGMSGGSEGGGDLNENATIEIHPDGRTTILTGTSPHGQGHSTVWAMLVHEELGVPMDRVTVRWGDTELIPEGGGTGASRSLQQGGSAVLQAARELIEVATLRAADVLEVSPEDLFVEHSHAGLAVRGAPGVRVSFADLAKREPLRVRSVFTAIGATFPFGAHVAVVEVDVETGRAVLRRLIALDDAGVLINPLITEGQRHGALAQGSAQALLEEVRYDEHGNPTSTTLDDYQAVSIDELPSFELVTSETPTPLNSLGAKGIGEAAIIGSTPAVQSAVVDAVAHLGVRHIDMPTSPMRVWAAVCDAARATAGRTERLCSCRLPSTVGRTPTRSSRGCCSRTTCVRCAG